MSFRGKEIVFPEAVPIEMIKSAKEISFPGDPYVAEAIEDLVKLGTLRRYNDKYLFKPGEEVIANCKASDKLVPIIILNSQKKPLKDLDLNSLALDGFMSSDEARRRMNEFYPGITPETEMVYITFVWEEVFIQFSPEIQRQLTFQPTEELIKNPRLRPLFFPSICQWKAWRQENANDWMLFLRKRELITEDEECKIRSFIGSLRMIPQQRRKLWNEPKHLQLVLDKREGEVYEALILMQVPDD